MGRTKDFLCTLVAGAIIGVSSMLPSCAATNVLLHNDKNDNHIEQSSIDKVLESTVKINIFADMNELTGAEGESGIYARLSSGSGIVLYDDDHDNYYVLTCDHVLPKEGKYAYPIENFIIEVDGVKAEIVAVDEENDLGLLQIPEPEVEAFEGKVADSYRVGDFIMGSGYDGLEKKRVFRGIISMEGIKKTILVDMSLNPGDSGGPVFVFKEGEPDLVGLNQWKFIYKERVGGLVTQEHIKDFLIETNDKTDLVDEYIN